MSRFQGAWAGESKAGVDRFLRRGFVAKVLVAVGILVYGTVAVYQRIRHASGRCLGLLAIVRVFWAANEHRPWAAHLRRLKPGDLVMIDLHPIVREYRADMCRTVCVALSEGTAVNHRRGEGRDWDSELEQTLHGIIKDAGYSDLQPQMHRVGMEFHAASSPSGHTFFHGEKAPPLEADMVIAVGNCGWYTGPLGRLGGGHSCGRRAGAYG